MKDGKAVPVAAVVEPVVTPEITEPDTAVVTEPEVEVVEPVVAEDTAEAVLDAEPVATDVEPVVPETPADAAIEPEVVEPEAEATPESEQLHSVFKVTDGVRSGRASTVNLTLADAEAYIAERPENMYDIVETE